MKQIEVEIMGQSYRLSCPVGGESRLQEAVSRVDLAMCKIRDNSKIRARDRIAVLAALNMAFDTADQVPADQAPTDNRPAALLAPVALAADTEKTNDRLHALLARLDTALGAERQLS